MENWIKIGKAESNYEFDFLYRKINKDGTRERLRLVIYPDMIKGTVRALYNKIRPSNEVDGFIEVASSDGWLHIADIHDHFRISNADFRDSRINKIVKIIKDILNDSSIKK